MLFVVLQTLRHATWLAATSYRNAIDRWGRWLDRSILVIIIVMFVNWGLVLVER